MAKCCPDRRLALPTPTPAPRATVPASAALIGISTDGRAIAVGRHRRRTPRPGLHRHRHRRRHDQPAHHHRPVRQHPPQPVRSRGRVPWCSLPARPVPVRSAVRRAEAHRPRPAEGSNAGNGPRASAAPGAAPDARLRRPETGCGLRLGGGRREPCRSHGSTAEVHGWPRCRGCRLRGRRGSLTALPVVGGAPDGVLGSRQRAWSSHAQSRENEGCDPCIVGLLRFGASMPDTVCHRHATLPRHYRACCPVGITAVPHAERGPA